MKRKKLHKNTIKKISTQRGAVELLLFAIIAIFAVLITGYLTFFNSSSFTNQSPPDSEWNYIVLPSPIQQDSENLHAQDINYITIPKLIDTLHPAGGPIPHTKGLKFNPHFVDPATYYKTITSNTNTQVLAQKAYAAPPTLSVVKNYLADPGNQGQFGSCTAWTTGYDMYGYYAKKNQFYPQPGGFDPPKGASSQIGGFAPMFTYSQLCTTPSCGTAFIDNMNSMKTRGIDRRDFYSNGDYSLAHPTSDEFAMALNYKTASYNILFSGGPFGNASAKQAVADIQNAIAMGDPVGIGMYVLPTFDNPDHTIPLIQNQGVRETDNHGIAEGHAVMAFAYDAQGLWIENSWGGTWGKKGTAELSWEYVMKQVDEAYTLTAIVPPVIPTLPPSPQPVLSPSAAPSNSPGNNPCATLNIQLDPVNCGVNGSNIGLFCGGNCGVSGNTGTLYQCQGTSLIGQVACSPKCITCSGAPRADQCGVDTSACGGGAPSVSITPGVSPAGSQCKASNGACAPANLCTHNCQSCGMSNDCQSGYLCCH